MLLGKRKEQRESFGTMLTIVRRGASASGEKADEEDKHYATHET